MTRSIPQKYKPEYDAVLKLDLLGFSQREIADMIDYSRSQIQRIQKNEQYQEYKKQLQEGEYGGVIEQVTAFAAASLPTSVRVIAEKMTDPNASDKIQLEAARDIKETFIPKLNRGGDAGAAVARPIVINVGGGGGPVYGSEISTSYEHICGECGGQFPPDEFDDHVCEADDEPAALPRNSWPPSVSPEQQQERHEAGANARRQQRARAYADVEAIKRARKRGKSER